MSLISGTVRDQQVPTRRNPLKNDEHIKQFRVSRRHKIVIFVTAMQIEVDELSSDLLLESCVTWIDRSFIFH